MADNGLGLPVRSESDGVDAKVVVKLVDGQVGGTNQMRIDADNNAHVEMHGNDPAGVDVVQLLTQEGRTTSRGDYDVTTNTKPSSNASILHSREAAPDETHQTFRPTGVASSDGSNAKAADVAIRDASGNAFTADNPLHVTVGDSPGDEINEYETSTTVSAGSSVDHDYTVTVAKRLKLSQVIANASGRLKVIVSVEDGVASDVFEPKFVGFNSAAEPNVQIPINENITVDAGVRVRVTLTNRDPVSQDVYSTICGHEID